MLIRQGAMPLQGALMTFPLWLFSTVFLWLHPPSGFTLLYTPFLLWYCITAQIFEQKMTSSLYSVHFPQYYTSLSPYTLAPFWGSIQIALTTAIIQPLGSDIMAIYCMHVSYSMCNNIFRNYARKSNSAHSNHPQNGRMAKFQKGKILCSNVWSLINKKSVKTSASAFYVQCSMKSYFSQRCVEEIDQLIKRRRAFAPPRVFLIKDTCMWAALNGPHLLPRLVTTRKWDS